MPEAQIIFDVFWFSLPAMINVGIVLIVIMFMYAIFGMDMFAFIKRRKGITSHANFQHFGLAFMTLFRLATVESWNELMDDCLRHIRPNDVCFKIHNFDDYQKYGLNACGNNLAYVYFLSYMIIVAFMLMNLFIAIVIESYEMRMKIQ
jgi:hypothetical protein